MKKLLLTSVFAVMSVFMIAQDCSNLFFSEYVEGSANNKTLEIYNPTNNAIDLSTYVIKRYANGSPFPTDELILSGTIQPKDVVVVTNGQTDSIWVTNGGYWSLPISEELYAKGDLHCSGIYPTPMYFNGNDAMTLETTTGGVIDIFGKIGEDPGENGWNDIPPSYTAGTQYWTSWTVDQTVIRKFSVKAGVTANPALFMINVEWDSIPKDSFDSLGTHHCDCGQMGIFDNQNPSHSVVLYPNPVLGNILNINTPAGWIRVEISTVTGMMVKEVTQNSITTSGQIDVSGLENGVYLVRITFTDQTVTQTKFIKR
jgi:hypothetical protein